MLNCNKIARFDSATKQTQSVKQHLDNVSGSCKQSAKNIGLTDTAYIVGLLHDMGKLSNDFQKYIKGFMNPEHIPTDKPTVDHAVYGAKYIFDKYKNGTSIQKLTSQIIALVVCYHHGGLPNSVTQNSEIPLLKRLDKINNNDYDDVVSEFEAAYKNFDLEQTFKKSCNEINSFLGKIALISNEKDETHFALHLLIKTIYSIIIDADWFDAYMFKAKSPQLKQTPLLNDIDKYITNIQNRLNEFKKIKPKGNKQKIVFEKRQEISGDCLSFANNKTGIYTLTVPTGGGKTLSSLVFALNHVKKNKNERIFYVAPYTSIIEQNANEIRDTLKCGDNLLEFHSNIINESHEKENENQDNAETQLLGERWDYQFVFTTMVQFLNAIYAPPSQNIRRMRSFANSIIIFDEVQTIPIHCISLFNCAVNFLSHCLNCTIVLCTATQPVLNKVERPINLTPQSEIVKDVQDAFNKLTRVEVVDKTINGGYTYQQAADFLLDLKQQSQSVLMIANTIKAAESIFNLLVQKNDNNRLFYLSSNLCPVHRKQVIKNIKTSLKNSENIICISTQVIECGVDISFNNVVRSLAGIDSIAQAAGRCNRHGESEMANTYIINLGDEYENTAKLKTINAGKTKANAILDLYKQNPDFFENSLLSTKSIHQYFMRYFVEETIKQEFDYPLKKHDTTIFELLSTNYPLRHLYNSYADSNYDLGFCYQFKTARENFQVIDQQIKTLIVPYKNGKEIIASLNSSLGLDEKIKLLKNAQHYCVNVFSNKYERLYKQGGISTCEIDGVFLLNEAFYDQEFLGIVLEKKMEFLNT